MNTPFPAFPQAHWKKALVCAGMLVLGARASHAQDFQVTNLNEGGAGSLQAAVIAANNAPGADTISFAAGLTGTIPVTSSPLIIEEALTINGPGASVLSLNGGGLGRIITYDHDDGEVRISGLTLTNGAEGQGNGGAIGFNGELPTSVLLTIENCIFTNNTATNGGAVFSGCITTIRNSEFSGNTASMAGGAINTGYFAQLTLENTTVAGNTAQSGGGLSTFGTTVQISQSTFSGNTAMSGAGGGLNLQGNNPATLVNSTIVNNTVSSNFSYGGGICKNASTLTLTNTIVSGNVRAATPNDIDLLPGATATGSNNIVGTNSLMFNSFTNNVNGNRIGTPGAPVNALLGALQNNGGLTRTHLPQTGSPAIDAGGATALTNDQRGTPFPRVIGTAVDIGAVEVDSVAPTAALSTIANVIATATLLQFNVVYSDNGAVLGSSLDGTDVRVTGPSGFDQLATFVSATPTNGAMVTATYSIVPPGGSWDPNDNGVYSVLMEGNQVRDTGGNTVAAGTLGMFAVGLNGGSNPSATPGSGTTVTVTFTFPNPPSAPLTTSVDFGDGTTGQPGTHTYNQPGTYTITVTVTGIGDPLVFTTTVTVAAATPPSTGANFRVRVAKIKLPASGTDSINVVGVISVPSNIDYAGKTLNINVGGATQSFTLDAKGKASSAGGKLKIAKPRNKNKKNSTAAQQVNFTTTITGAFAALIKANTPLDEAGLPTSLPVTVLFNDQTYRQTLSVKFKAKKNVTTTRFGFF